MGPRSAKKEFKMPEETTNESTTESNTTSNPPDLAAQLAALQSELSNWKAESRKHEKRAKDNATELASLKSATLSDTDKAIADAVASAQKSWKAETGWKLAAATFRANAAGKIPDESLSTLMSGLNFGGFLNDDGEPDEKSISSFIDGIAPKSDNKPPAPHLPGTGQGPRGNGNGAATSLNSDELTNMVLKHVGLG